MRRIALLFCLVPLVTTTSAHAGWRIHRAQQIAAIVWNHPCNDQVQIVWEPNSAAQVSDLAEAWVIPGQCTIYMSTDQPRTWWDVCDDILHEYGHLAGYRDPTNTADPMHSSNEDSVMYGGLVHIDDPRCNDLGRPYLAAHQPVR